jgi:adenylate cyclase
VERRLAAILAADVAGYSRLMSVDESGTLANLQAHRSELIVPAIAKHRGRVVKLMGDGILAEFGSVVDAVECAAEIQREMAARNADVADDRRLGFRIGVHLGDVIVEGEDIYGDGVNIAARLESLAEPAASAFPARPTIRSTASWRSNSGSSARSISRTSRSRSKSSRSAARR